METVAKLLSNPIVIGVLFFALLIGWDYAKKRFKVDPRIAALGDRLIDLALASKAGGSMPGELPTGKLTKLAVAEELAKELPLSAAGISKALDVAESAIVTKNVRPWDQEGIRKAVGRDLRQTVQTEALGWLKGRG